MENVHRKELGSILHNWTGYDWKSLHRPYKQSVSGYKMQHKRAWKSVVWKRSYVGIFCSILVPVMALGIMPISLVHC